MVTPPPYVPAAVPDLDTQDDARRSGRRPSILKPLLLSLMVVVGVAGVIVWQAGLMPDMTSYVQNQAFLKSLAFWQDQPSDQKAVVQQDQNADQIKPALTQPESAPNSTEHDADASLAQAAPLRSGPVQSDLPQDSAEPAVAKPSPLAPPAATAQEFPREVPERRTREAVKIPVVAH